jgi:hypothetical protein
MEYENVIRKALLPVESILKNAKQLQHSQFYFVVSGFKIIGHGNTDSNLVSHCITKNWKYTPRATIMMH